MQRADISLDTVPMGYVPTQRSGLLVDEEKEYEGDRGEENLSNYFDDRPIDVQREEQEHPSAKAVSRLPNGGLYVPRHLNPVQFLDSEFDVYTDGLVPNQLVRVSPADSVSDVEHARDLRKDQKLGVSVKPVPATQTKQKRRAERLVSDLVSLTVKGEDKDNLEDDTMMS